MKNILFSVMTAALSIAFTPTLSATESPAVPTETVIELAEGTTISPAATEVLPEDPTPQKEQKSRTFKKWGRDGGVVVISGGALILIIILLIILL
jgi:hypothetical protein